MGMTIQVPAIATATVICRMFSQTDCNKKCGKYKEVLSPVTYIKYIIFHYIYKIYIHPFIFIYLFIKFKVHYIY